MIDKIPHFLGLMPSEPLVRGAKVKLEAVVDLFCVELTESPFLVEFWVSAGQRRHFGET